MSKIGKNTRNLAKNDGPFVLTQGHATSDQRQMDRDGVKTQHGIEIEPNDLESWKASGSGAKTPLIT